MGEQLYIPSFIVRAAGFLAGDRAFISNGDPTDPAAMPICVLSKEKPPGAMHDCIVSKDCHLLVTLTMLKSCGLNADNLEIDGNAGRIVIRRSRAAESRAG
ncbi:MAG: hypothetical protein IT426_13460 [Pirellulales bacterium]|nr:hypothetical protein [Pirellulales bacterium]